MNGQVEVTWRTLSTVAHTWYGGNQNRRSYGKIGYVSVQIWENGPIWIVGFRNNFSRCRYAVYLVGVQRRMPNLRSSFNVSGNWTSRDERTSWSDLENVEYSCAHMVWRKSKQKKLWTNWIFFNPYFGKIDQSGWWDLEKISADAGTQFTPTEFKEECQTCGVRLTLAAPEHQ